MTRSNSKITPSSLLVKRTTVWRILEFPCFVNTCTLNSNLQIRIGRKFLRSNLRRKSVTMFLVTKNSYFWIRWNKEPVEFYKGPTAVTLQNTVIFNRDSSIQVSQWTKLGCTVLKFWKKKRLYNIPCIAEVVC